MDENMTEDDEGIGKGGGRVAVDVQMWTQMRTQMQMLKMNKLLVLQTMILHMIWCSGQEWTLMLKTK